MIPRYDPTYTYANLFYSLRLPQQMNTDRLLCEHLSKLYNISHVFLTDSARVALYVILKAYDRPGEVVMPAYNCIVVPEAVEFAGYKPIFADIDYETLNINLDTLSRAISPRTTVLLATHLFGIPCQVDELCNFAREHGILVVEDAAPALGAEFHGQITGSFGDAAVVSFQSTKVIAGESGGALLTNNDELADKIEKIMDPCAGPGRNLQLPIRAFARKLVTHPKVYPLTHSGYQLLKAEPMYEIVRPLRQEPSDFLSRCSGYSSSLVLTQLDHLDWNLKRRRRLAEIYQTRLSGQTHIKTVSIPADCAPAWIQFPVMTHDKESFFKRMQRQQVDLSWTYRYSCAESYDQANCPNARKAAKTVLGLPTYPTISDEQAEFICRLAQEYEKSVL
jgi:perosamine synthetase